MRAKPWTIVGVFVFGAGCAPSPEPLLESTDADGTIAASERTRQELGVVRWSKKEAPDEIAGRDDAGKVVVLLGHYVKPGEREGHAVVLREHEREAVTQFELGNNEYGAETFFLQRADRSPGLDPKHVIELMNADFAASAADTKLAANSASSAAAHLLERTNDTAEPLVCMENAPLVTGDTCLSRAWDPRWWGPCREYAKRSGAEYNQIRCHEQGNVQFNDCICIELDNVTQSSKPGDCHWFFDGEYQRLVAEYQECRWVPSGSEKNECGKECTTYTKQCTTATVRCQ